MSLSSLRYLDEWEFIREELIVLIKTNDNKKIELMRKGIELLMAILNEVAEAAPLNYIERVIFIESNMVKYVAFVQLEELFKETKKKIARIRAQMNH
ncbi:YpoC family protein [Psychrobacillus psychrodurans]|uniref:YpoC family protein n=1 Tax=Psychrobacillus psychrodurans TaxID=126157 RepID=UPI003D0841C8